MNNIFQFFAVLLTAVLVYNYPSFAESSEKSKEEVINAIVAVVDKEAITLADLQRLHSSPNDLTWDSAGKDQQARQILELLISNQLIKEEAESRKIQASDGEIDTYIKRVADRNKLTLKEFEAALAKENKTLDFFKEHSRIEILRSKLSSQIFQEGVGVSEGEIDRFIAEHPEYTKSGEKVKLSQILVPHQEKAEGGPEKLISMIEQKLAAGEEFSRLAMMYSDAPEGPEGGSLGILSVKDLSSWILNAITSLKSGELSGVTMSPQGYHIFLLEERFSGDAEELRAEAKKIIKRQRLNTKLQAFFTTEIYKLHSIERRI